MKYFANLCPRGSEPGLKVNRECAASIRLVLARARFLLTDRYAEARTRYCTCAGNRTFRTGSGPHERQVLKCAGRSAFSAKRMRLETAVLTMRRGRKSSLHLGDFILKRQVAVLPE